VTPVSFLLPANTIPSSKHEGARNGSSSQSLGSWHILPVRVWGVDAHDLPFMQLASVKNLSGTGAVIHGMRHPDASGRIWKCRWTRKRPSSVVWTGMPGTHAAGEIGLQRLASEPYLWGVALGCYSELVAEG